MDGHLYFSYILSDFSRTQKYESRHLYTSYEGFFMGTDTVHGHGPCKNGWSALGLLHER